VAQDDMTERERRGQVLDDEGRPVPGALVTVVSGTVPVPELALIADHEGQVRLRLPDGRYRLRAIAATGQSGEGEVSGADTNFVITIRGS
jgi:hypothetical protein